MGWTQIATWQKALSGRLNTCADLRATTARLVARVGVENEPAGGKPISRMLLSKNMPPSVNRTCAHVSGARPMCKMIMVSPDHAVMSALPHRLPGLPSWTFLTVLSEQDCPCQRSRQEMCVGDSLQRNDMFRVAL